MKSIKDLSINKLRQAYIPYHKRIDLHSNPPFLFALFLADLFLLLKYHLKYIFPIVKEFPKTRRLYNSMKGKRAFVFANGPSLNKLDFSKIEKYQRENGFNVFAVNSFVVLQNQLKPDFYVLSDHAFFGNKEHVTPARYAEILKTKEILKDYKIPIFVPINVYEEIKREQYPNSVYYFNDCEFVFFNRNVSNILKPRSYSSMTAYKALAIALYMGFDKIYICGFDNDWFKTINVDSKNQISYINRHFKEQKDSGMKIVPKWEAENLAISLHVFAMLFYDLYKFPKEKIINLDRESLVDAFPKTHELDIYRDI